MCMKLFKLESRLNGIPYDFERRSEKIVNIQSGQIVLDIFLN